MKLTASNCKAYAESIGLHQVSIKNIRDLRNFCATISSKEGDFLIKQEGGNTAVFGEFSLQTELDFYEFLQDRFVHIKSLAPSTFSVDSKNKIVIIAYFNDAQYLELTYQESSDIQSKNLGKCIAKLHQTPCPSQFPITKPENYLHSYDRVTPEEFNIGGPLFAHFLELIQRYPIWNKEITKLKTELVYDTLIHGDLKQDNILVVLENKQDVIKIIDWELMSRGDRYLDLGYVVGNYISALIDQVDYDKSELEVDGQSMDGCQSLIANFIHSYLDTLEQPLKINYIKLSRCSAIYLLNQFYGATRFKNEYSKRDLLKMKMAKTLLVDAQTNYHNFFMKSITSSYATFF